MVPSIEYVDNIGAKLLPPCALHFFDADELQYLRQSYASLIPDIDVIEVPQAYGKYKAAEWWSQHLETDKHGNSTCIKAYWIGENSKIAKDPVDFFAGKIFFFSQNILIDKQVVMVKVQWFQGHQNRNIQNLELVEI